MSYFDKIREDFPQTTRVTRYFDSAATSLKYEPCIDQATDFLKVLNSNVHRGTHTLSRLATNSYEEAREKAAHYFGVKTGEVVFTKGTTDSINLLAFCFMSRVKEGQTIVLTEMEHHANLIPWQRVAETKGLKLKFLEVDDAGEIAVSDLEALLASDDVALVSLCHFSNTLGTRNPIEEIAKLCRANNVPCLVDGAQGVTVERPNLGEIGLDAYCFSFHKLFGPFGLGMLYIKEDLLKEFHPYQLGGAIIDKVEFEKTTFLDAPHLFEPGTPNVPAVISLIPLFKFLHQLDFKAVREHERDLMDLMRKEMGALGGFLEVGKSPSKLKIMSFNFEGVHSNDLCEILDEQHFALRSGHHCTQPLLRKMGINHCARASVSIYNTKEEVYDLANATKKALEILR